MTSRDQRGARREKSTAGECGRVITTLDSPVGLVALLYSRASDRIPGGRDSGFGPVQYIRNTDGSARWYSMYCTVLYRSTGVQGSE
jgi:hypothetical protein